MAAKRQGLRLTLPGAPTNPHTLPGYPGFYHPLVPTPVGKEGELDLDTAKALHQDKGVDVELVEIPANEINAAEKFVSETLVEARKGIIAETELASGKTTEGVK